MSVENLLADGLKVGGVFSTGYDECDVLTNDWWTQEAGGLPKHSLLVAKPLLEGSRLVDDDEVHTGHRLPSKSTDSEDESRSSNEASHALLLRVKGPADLPDEGRLTSNRHDAIRQAITAEKDGEPTDDDFVDVLTRRELQYSGIRANVLGTFYYTENEDGNRELTFGSDVQTFFSAGHYVVHKPAPEALAWIASYPTSDSDSPIKLGEVKYTSTRIYDDRTPSPVYIDIEDFIGSKTAVFGMTRKGKSNTMKILAAAIAAGEASVGQLVFDPSGEYAYENDQDECALGELYDGGVSISTVYKFNPAEGEDDYKPLRSNLLDRNNQQIVQSYVRSLLVGETADYVGKFLSTKIPTENEIDDLEGGERNRAKWLQSAYYAVLSKAIGEDRLPDNFEPFWIKVNDNIISLVNEAADLEHTKIKGSLPLGKWNGENQIVDFWEAVEKRQDDINKAYRDEGNNKDWVDDDLANVLEMFNTDGSQSGYGKLTELRHFHNPDSEEDVAAEIYEKLDQGEMVVVDISNGREDLVERETTRIVNHVRSKSRERFRSTEKEDRTLPEIQIYLEEAHRHFEKEEYRDGESMSPYVELAKEGAKFNIGMTYATQEVSSIDRRVLSNTSNWIVTHLNSDREIKRLAEYYNFEDFKSSLKNVEEKGFVRLKTSSGEYIVPLQVDLFDREWITTNTAYSIQKREEGDDDVESGSE
ncbi:hypothetical protein C2R22_02480 [Salinigranum rubrum]|uniref:Helicase HerA central domain-containing protein n=2 Tax=Salinigranum rubrum TaxID=755307 RepID=A0A2I8VRM6_9EURY|nr:hypothetical protein C2R22_02480 [Salinigranum rubrum]